MTHSMFFLHNLAMDKQRSGEKAKKQNACLTDSEKRDTTDKKVLFPVFFAMFTVAGKLEKIEFCLVQYVITV
ncbi:hypothetical protein QA596_05000 [Balneolales bacterium ANBcel1]|nr:hypothetical protein [Balneolales bacterium ANBcel1]